jgi:TraG P-loop domain
MKFSYPIQYIGPIFQTTDKRYKAIAKISPVNAELLADDDLVNVFETIQGALNTYQDGRIGIYIQSERVDIEQNLLNIDLEKEKLNSELKIELLEEQRIHLSSMTDRSRNVLNFYVVLETTQTKYNAAEQILNDGIDGIKGELDSEDMIVYRLDEYEIKKFFYERFNPDSSYYEPFQEHWDIDEIAPKTLVKDKDGKHIENDERYYRFFSIINYPVAVDQFRWLRRIFNMNGDINISITLTPKDKSTINKKLSNASREIGSKALDTSLPRHIQLKYQKEKESADDLIEELANDNNTLYDVNITIAVSHKDKDKLSSLVNTLKSKVSSSHCQALELRYKDFHPYWTVMPTLVENKITKDYVWNLSSADVASIIPFDSSELMEEKGLLQGENTTSKGLIIVDPFNKQKYNNPHQCIIADSGSGKSFYISCDAIRNVPYRDYIIMFDVEGEFFFPWGTRIKFTPTTGIISNPFHIRNAIIDTDGQDDGVEDVGGFLALKIMDTITFFKWIYPEMTSFDESLLEEDITDAYKKVGLTLKSTSLPEKFPTLSTLDEVMQEKINEKGRTQKEVEHRTNMKASFRPYIHGAYSGMFNGQTNWEFDFHTVFDISMVSETVRKPLYDIILKDVWQFCKTDRKFQKRLYVDEAHEFADPKRPQTLQFLSTIVKRGRKYGVSMVTATQNLPDFLSIERYGQAIIDNSYFKIFFRLGETDLDPAQSLYKFSEREMKILRQKTKLDTKKGRGNKGKGIFIAGSQRVEIQTIASKFELEIIDPDQFEDIYQQPSRYRKTKKKDNDPMVS